MNKTNITEEHKDFLELIRSPDAPDARIALFSCFVNGEPTSAIVFVTTDDDGQYVIRPMFVAVTPGMVLADHDGAEPSAVDDSPSPQQGRTS